MAICGSCSSSTPVKINYRHLLSDTFRFSSGVFHDLFPSVPVGDFFLTARRANPDIYPDLPGDSDYHDCIMLCVPLCLPLSTGVIIKEDPVTDEGVVELLTRHNHIAGEWDVLMDEDHIVAATFLNDI